MVKIAASTLTLTVLVGTAIAAPTYYDDAELQQRSPLGLGLIFKGVKGAVKAGEGLLGGHSSNNNNHRRSLDADNELQERSPFGLGFLVKGVEKAVGFGEHALSGGSNNNNNHRRSLDFEDELQERSPFGLGFLVKGVEKAVGLGEHALSGSNNNNNHRRSLDFENDLEERSPFGLGFLVKGVEKAVDLGEHALSGGSNNNNHRRSLDFDDEFVTREDLDDIFGREFVDDLEERSPFGLGFLVKGVEKVASIGAHALGGGSNNNKNHRRSLDFEDELFVTREDLDDLFGREFVDDLEERSPFGLGFLVKGVEKVVGLGAKALGGGNSNNKNHRRSLDIEDELLERGFYDDLD